MSSHEILLVALGWIVPGGITLGGVLLASWILSRRRDRHEDRVAIFEPLHKQMVRTLERGYLYKSGYGIEAFEEGFWNIYNRAALHPKRHSLLRRDTDRLVSLHKESDRLQTEFRETREAALDEAAGEIEVLDADGNSISLASLFPRGSWSGHELTESGSSGDKERFLNLVDGRMQGMNASVPEGREPPAEALFREAGRKMRPVHETYEESCKLVLAHVEYVKARLEDAIRRAAGYRDV